MSVLYCAIPYFAAALAQRDDPSLRNQPLALIGPGQRVLGVSAQAASCQVTPGMPARTAQMRCPEAHLLETDVDRCQSEAESLLQLLETASPDVEPHGWGAAYVDLGDLARGYDSAVSLCQGIGQTVRRELGESLQPALGWDSGKFTAQAAARRTQPGHVRAVDTSRESSFLRPLAVTLLPLAEDVLQRLQFLGLRTLGQYAGLSRAAVWQQFGQAGKLAHRCAQGQDPRPVVPRWQAARLAAQVEFETPLSEQPRLVAALDQMLSPLLADLRGNLQACGQVRLAVHMDDGRTLAQERTFLFPISDSGRLLRVLEQLLDKVEWQPKSVPGSELVLERKTLNRHLALRIPADADLIEGAHPGAGVSALSLELGQIQDAVAKQLTLFSFQGERETKLQEVQRYLSTRFGANHLRQAAITHPGAPLAEWRTSWLDETS